MNGKTVELNAAKEKLAKLIDDLQEQERQYDKAIEHSANYMGNDENIEHARDEMARGAYESVERVKKEIGNQTKLIEALVAAY